LLSGNYLSPHAFDIVLANQMSIRLSRAIVDMPIKVNFVATEVALTNPHIDSDAFSVFLHDWIASKISFKWLKAHYMQWGTYTLSKTPNFSADHPVLRMPLIQHFTGFVDYFTKGQTLHQLIDSKKFPEETAYKALHLLLAKGLLVFSEKIVANDSEHRIKVLKNLQAQVANKNKLEIWDRMVAMAGVSDSEPQLVIAEFKKILGIAPAADQKEAYKIFSELQQIAEEAFRFAQAGNRDQLKEELAKAELEKKIKAARLAEEARAALQKSQFAQAEQLLLKAISLDPSIEKIKIHLIWAQLGRAEGTANKEKVIKDLEVEFMQIPPEERYDAIYPFVMGLFYKAKGEFVAAKKSFEKAYNMDGNLLAARREIAALSAKVKRQEPAKGDLKDLVAGFFKKK
jgi:tetratricopeptide (TPR) repeat protein